MSCDQTHDVLKHFLIGFNKYWPDCPYDIYIGSNTELYNKKYKYVHVQKTNWRSETIDQIEGIKKIDDKLTHLIVFLDDFILKKIVLNNALNEFIKLSFEKEIKYLRLKKVEEPLLITIFYKIFNSFNSSNIFKIRKNHPYFSSLQIALWDIDYLDILVKKCKNIWDFEKTNLKNYSHYSVSKSIFSYKHVVEKGKWEFYAKNYCIKNINYFEQGYRKTQISNINRKLYFLLKHIKFLFLGYIKFSK